MMLLCSALRGSGQSAPTITNPPASQTVYSSSNVTFSVGVAGPGPFTDQWKLYDSNLPAIVSTETGNGSTGYSGDGRAATNAGLYYSNTVTKQVPHR